jgi:hypothetical protein
MIVWLMACAPLLDGELEPISTLEATFEWTLSFDDDAKEAGFRDCTYTRTYAGEEDRSVPWLCPACDEVWRATVSMPDDDQDCLVQISGMPPAPVEWLGVGDGSWWRGTENNLLAPSTGLDDRGGELSVAYETEWMPLFDGAVEEYHLAVEGTATRGEVEGDPFHGYAPPDAYTCGWPSRHAPEWEGPWSLEVGEIVPDGAFLDRCDEPVRIHDLAGSWLVIDVSAMDCSPCQAMAADEKAFLATTDANVQVMTLLVTSLQEPLAPTTRADIDAWGDTFDIEHPVVRDRGWGFWMGYQAFDQSFGYPTTIVVGPDGRIRDQWVGYGGWSWVQDVIDKG